MNTAQRVVALFGVLAILALALRPPWWGVVVEPTEAAGIDVPVFDGFRAVRADIALERRVFLGFRSLRAAPPTGEGRADARPDFAMAASLQLAVLVATLVAVCLLRRRRA